MPKKDGHTIRTVALDAIVIEKDGFLSREDAFEEMKKVSRATRSALNQMSSIVFTKEETRRLTYNDPRNAHLSKDERTALANDAEREYFAKVLGDPDGASQSKMYRILLRRVPDLPSGVASALVNGNYAKLSKSARNTFDASMPSFRKDVPVPFPAPPFKIVRGFEEGQTAFYGYLTIKKNVRVCFKLKMTPGLYRSGIQETLVRLITETDGHVACSIKDKDGFRISFQVNDPIVKKDLDENKVLGVDLGMAVPAYVMVNTTGYGCQIGTDVVLSKKESFRTRYRDLKSSLRFTSGGHGREQKLQKLEAFQEHEHNFTKDISFKIAKEVVSYAERQRCAYINLESLQFSNDKKKAFDGKFPYYMIQQRIAQLAEKSGIKVRYVNPAQTSQRCSVCGELGHRPEESKRDFFCLNEKCEMHGKKVHADKNAAMNIAKMTVFVKEAIREA